MATSTPRRALLDVNVLIALVDPKHASSARAHAWFAANNQAKAGVATCPIVQNGVARILSQPAYSSRAQFSVRSVVQVLRDFCVAVANDGLLVTFDSAIAATSAVVRGALAEHVLVL